MSRSSRKRRRAERRRKKERKSKRRDRELARAQRDRDLAEFGFFINLIGADLMVPRAKIVIF